MDKRNLETVDRPVGEARGLSNAHYTDEHVFATEQDALFFDGWAGVGFAKDVPDHGSVRPVTFLGQPLLLVRSREGEVRVFENVCRHRGMILVNEPRLLKGAIRCPYHSWCYGLDGRLVSTPHVGGPGQNLHDDIDRSTLGLIEVRSQVWRDVIFVNLSGNAPPFEEYNSDLRHRWSEFEKPLFHGGDDSSFKLEVACNWKLAVENYCESYHLPWIHPGLNAYSRLEDHYNIEHPSAELGAFSGQGTKVYRPMMSEDGARFAEFNGLSAQWDEGAEYVALYPNVLFGVHKDHAFAIVLEPTSVGTTVEHIELYYADEAMRGVEYAAMRANNSSMWKEVFEEDIFVVEGMQRGRSAQGFDGGRFSPVMDSPTHCLHRWTAQRLLHFERAENMQAAE